MLAISTHQLQRIIPNLFEQLELGKDVIITHLDQPIAKIVPLQSSVSVADLFADIRKTATFSADLDEPTIDEWVFV